MEQTIYNEILGKKIEVSDIKKSDKSSFYTGYAKDEDREVCILSDKTEDLIVIAVIENNDGTEKWIASDSETAIIEPDMRRMLKDDSDSEYHCLYEKTCGSIVYKLENGVRYYLLIENHTGHIGFPKGHVEYGETEEETAAREVLEETGLAIHIDSGTRQEYTYKNKDGIIKNCIYYCSEFKDDVIKLQPGEIMRCWLVQYNDAFRLLNYPYDKIIFAKADKMND
ncbi:MAG: NUDIX domain-containing protein [Porcipelethomonas sp.]